MPTYGALDRQAPDYIYQLLVKHTAAHSLCSQAQNLLAVLCTRRKTRELEPFSLWHRGSGTVYYRSV